MAVHPKKEKILFIVIAVRTSKPAQEETAQLSLNCLYKNQQKWL
jgi:hypothetical protein